MRSQKGTQMKHCKDCGCVYCACDDDAGATLVIWALVAVITLFFIGLTAFLLGVFWS